MLLERGVILPKRRLPLVKRLDELMKGELLISPRALRLLQDLRDEWIDLDRRIKAYDDELAALTREDEMARRLATVPGIGVINATALLAAVGDGSAFSRGRDLAAWLGLTPRQHSTGGKTKLLGISKRGNSYLRTQLIHGARSAMAHFAGKQTPMGAWVRQLLTRAHPQRRRCGGGRQAGPHRLGRCCANGVITSTRPWRPDHGVAVGRRRSRARGLWR